MTTADTRDMIMTVARATVQAHVYNALSFRELAKAVGIKSASVHYHFPTKGVLGAALARRYSDDAVKYLDALLADSRDQTSRMKAYTEIFRTALLNDNRMCLCGIMSAERDDLPAEVRAEVDRFADVNVHWLTEVLLSPRKPGLSKQATQRRALAIFSAVQGAQLVARGRASVAVYDQTIEAGLIP